MHACPTRSDTWVPTSYIWAKEVPSTSSYVRTHCRLWIHRIPASRLQSSQRHGGSTLAQYGRLGSGLATDPAVPYVLDMQRRLATQKLDQGDAANMDLDGHCVVCLDALAEPCQLFPCGHRHFHFPCVHLWLLENQSRACPICKASVSNVVYGAADGQQTHEYGALDSSLLPPTGSHSSRPVSQVRQAQPPPNTAFLPGRARRHLRGPQPWRAPAHRDEPAGMAFRRDVYRRLRYSMHVGSNSLSRYRELTRDSFRNDDELQRRARAFLRRELRVFSWLTTPDAGSVDHSAGEGPRSFQGRRRTTTVERLLGHIIWLLQHFELRGSDGSVEDVVTAHLGRENTRLLVHELHSFLRSPYSTLEDWDREAQYSEHVESRTEQVDRTRDPSVTIGRHAREQRSATSRYQNRYRPKDGLTQPDVASIGINRSNAPVDECHAGSSRGPYIHEIRDSSSGGGVTPDARQRQAEDEGAHRPARSVDNGCGPTKR